MADILIGNVKGPQGDTGATGATGPQGDAATIAVGSTTTVPYGQAARVTNSGTSGAAVFDFVIPQGRPGEQVNKIDNLTIDAITEPSTAFPVPAVGDNGSTLFGKISKWFSDMAALVASKLDASNVVNNLTTTASGYALDARQGKALNDRYGRFVTYNINGSMGSAISRLGNQYLWLMGDMAILRLCFFVSAEQSAGTAVCTLPTGYTYTFMGNAAANVWGSVANVTTLNISGAGAVTLGAALSANGHVEFTLIGRAIAN